MMEVGRVCLKIAGREAGKYCVIVENLDNSFVMITGPKSVTRIKRRKCNIVHLEPTQDKFDISEKADDQAVEKAWKTSKLLEKFNISLKPKAE